MTTKKDVYAQLLRTDPDLMAFCKEASEQFGASLLYIEDLRTGERIVDRTGHGAHKRAVEKLKEESHERPTR